MLFVMNFAANEAGAVSSKRQTMYECGHSTQPFWFALLMLATLTVLKFQIFNEHINKNVFSE